MTRPVPPEPTSGDPQHKVLWRKDLSDSVFVLGLERHRLDFVPGQYLSLGCRGSLHTREYSIYSGTGDDWLEVLVRRVPGGLVSNQLGRLDSGDRVRLEGPFGNFVLPETLPPEGVVMVASGTGIAPFRSMLRSRPDLPALVLHGIRQTTEAWGQADFTPGVVRHCVSGQPGGPYHGRVTAWLRDHQPDPRARYLLCGNCDMVYDSYELLVSAGVPAGHIGVEVFF